MWKVKFNFYLGRFTITAVRNNGTIRARECKITDIFNICNIALYNEYMTLLILSSLIFLKTFVMLLEIPLACIDSIFSMAEAYVWPYLIFFSNKIQNSLWRLYKNWIFPFLYATKNLVALLPLTPKSYQA